MSKPKGLETRDADGITRTENERERRVFLSALEVRAGEDDQENTIFGYALKWSEVTQIGRWFTEQFRQGAFAETLAEDDQIMMLQHESLPIARKSAGSLTLREDDTGLYFESTLDQADPDAVKALVKVRNKSLKGVSVGFTLYDGGEELWTNGEDNDPDHREIVKVGELFEISLVSMAQYKSSEVSARCFERDKTSNESVRIRERARIKEAHRVRGLNL